MRSVLGGVEGAERAGLARDNAFPCVVRHQDSGKLFVDQAQWSALTPGNIKDTCGESEEGRSNYAPDGNATRIDAASLLTRRDQGPALQTHNQCSLARAVKSVPRRR